MDQQSKEIDFSPRGYFLEYPLFVDYAISKFIEDFQDQSFKQRKDGVFILKRIYTKKDLEILFKLYLQEFIDNVFLKLDKEKPTLKNKIFFIADSGDLRRKGYLMCESDIDIHLKKWEKAANSFFNNFFTKKQFIDNYNVIWCKHKYLLAYDWEKVLTVKIFGKKNFQKIDINPKKSVIKEIQFEDISLTSEQNKLIISEIENWLRTEIF